MIAIVGNSGSLLNNEYGGLINNHDFVIRFNVAPIKGFGRYVGDRTNLRFIAHHTDYDYSFIRNESIMLYSYSNKAIEEAYSKLWDQNRVVLLNKKFIQRCDNMISKSYWKWRFIPGRRIVHKKMSTTGLKAIIYALDQREPNPVSLFGFDTEGLGGQFHYYEKNRPGYKPTDSHDYEKEKQIIKGFEKEGRLKIWS